MPLNNNFYGVYKFATIRTDSPTLGVGKNPYIIKSLASNDSMPAQATFFMQGTPLTKVLDIRAVSKSITINAPILVPTAGNSLMDGLQLLWDLAALQYVNNIPTNALPLLESVTIDIGVDQSTSTFTLKTDGDPNNDTNIFEINYGTTAQNYITTTGLNNAARVAKNYDFCVDFGGLKYFVDNCKMTIKVNTSEHNFLGVYGKQPPRAPTPGDQSVPIDGLNGGVWNPLTLDELGSYSGWQFPFIAMGGIEIDITGTAAISIDNTTGDKINWNYNDNVTSDIDQLILDGNVTLQPSGVFRYVQENFNIYFTGNETYAEVLPPAFAVNNAIVTKKGATFSEGLMKADFEVKAFVGI